MPQTSDQLEQPVHPPGSDVTESSERLLKPRQKSPHQMTDVISENGSVTSSIGRVHTNGLVISANGTVKSHAKNHSNGTSAVVHRPVPPAGGSDGCVVIREVYENGLASEFFALQLDYALDAGAQVIVIEPSRLGRETAQWLAIGTGLRRSALSAWLLSLLAAALRYDGTSLLCAAAGSAMATVYAVSWRPDPCSGYRVERNSRQLQRLPLRDVACTTPVVLVRRQHSQLRHGIYSSVAVATLGVCAWRMYVNHLI